MNHVPPVAGSFIWALFHIEHIVRAYALPRGMHWHCTAHRIVHRNDTLVYNVKHITIRMSCVLHKVVRTGFPF